MLNCIKAFPYKSLLGLFIFGELSIIGGSNMDFELGIWCTTSGVVNFYACICFRLELFIFAYVLHSSHIMHHIIIHVGVENAEP